MSALILGAGCLIVVFLLLVQNSIAAYSMSAFEIVRFSLISFLPLVALIVGNRLIVNEYLNGTRLFLEALPVGAFVPLTLKYLLGFAYIAFIATVMVLLAAQQSGIADDVTPEYVQLILAKTWVMVSLYWSIVFCFSLCGYLRIALYLLVAAIVALLAYYPGLDASRFAPMALMDSQLFVYERDSIPWSQMGITLVLSAGFTAAGFILTRIGEGSVIERLAKPMTRRDYVALGVLAASGLALASALMDQNQREPIDFSSSNVIRLADPDVSVLYLAEEYKDSAEALAGRISGSLVQLQTTLALSALPTVRLALTPSRDKHDIDYATYDGVFVAANWLEHDSFDNAIFDAVIMHGVLSAQTNGRSVFEPYHWILDGFTRWWVEQGSSELREAHRHELVARALFTLDRDPQAVQLIENWQLTADRFSYPNAESLAWAAMVYLEQTQGRSTVIALANLFLTQPVAANAMVSFRERISVTQSKVESVIGMSLQDFYKGWEQWLRGQRSDPGVQQFSSSIPALFGRVETELNEMGVRSINAYYVPAPGYTAAADDVDLSDSSCRLKHGILGPFDTEYDVPDDDEDISDCTINGIAHTINSTYASGDRVYVALDYEGGLFHQPIRLHAQRITIP